MLKVKDTVLSFAMIRWKLAVYRKAAFLKIGIFQNVLDRATNIIRDPWKIWRHMVAYKPDEILTRAISRMLRSANMEMLWGFNGWKNATFVDGAKKN
jgi:hypothetical protein